MSQATCDMYLMMFFCKYRPSPLPQHPWCFLYRKTKPITPKPIFFSIQPDQAHDVFYIVIETKPMVFSIYLQRPSPWCFLYIYRDQAHRLVYIARPSPWCFIYTYRDQAHGVFYIFIETKPMVFSIYLQRPSPSPPSPLSCLYRRTKPMAFSIYRDQAHCPKTHHLFYVENKPITPQAHCFL